MTNKKDVDRWLGKSVNDVGFKGRLTNALLDHGVRRVIHVYSVDTRTMKRWSRVGKTTVNELVDWLRAHPDPRYWEDGSIVRWDEHGNPLPKKPAKDPLKLTSNTGLRKPPETMVMAGFCDKLVERRERLVELIKDAAVIKDGGGRRMRHFTSRLTELDTTIKLAKSAGVWVK